MSDKVSGRTLSDFKIDEPESLRALYVVGMNGLAAFFADRFCKGGGVFRL